MCIYIMLKLIHVIYIYVELSSCMWLPGLSKSNTKSSAMLGLYIEHDTARTVHRIELTLCMRHE